MEHSKFFLCCKVILIGLIVTEIQANSSNVMSLVKQYSPSNETVEIITLSSGNTENFTEVTNDLDFVVKLQVVLNPEKIVPYLREEVYENYEKHNITTKDLIDLWKLREYDLRYLSDMVEIPDILLNLSTFRILLGVTNLTFNQYYSEIKKNLTNNQLLDTLQILNINLSNFSTANTFGTEDDIYKVLDKGVYSWEKFEEVENATGLNIPTETKNIILDHLTNKSISSITSSLRGLPMMKEMYKNIWDRMNITTFDIYKVVNLRRIIDNIHQNITEDIILGVSISEHEIIVHEQMLPKLRSVMDIINIYGETSNTHQIYDNLTLGEIRSKNFATLWTNNSIIERVKIIDRMENISSSDCFYVDNDLIGQNVTFMSLTESNVTISVDDDVIFNVGNPVICDRKLLGLTAEKIPEKNMIRIDTLFKKGDEANGSNKLYFHSYMCLLAILVFIYRY